MALKWGCLGPGLVCKDFFTAIRENLPPSEHKFVAVASKDLSRAKCFAEQFNFRRAYGSYDDISTDNDVEVVYIATLNTTHARLSTQMLNAGKHVLCEKPMAMNAEEAKEVFEAARRNNRVFMEGMWTRFLPAYAHVRKEIMTGSIGNIKRVEATFKAPIQHIARINSAHLGGGGLRDIGVYLITFACMIFKEMPADIKAHGRLSKSGEVDIESSMIFKYTAGAIAELSYDTDADSLEGTACIVGENGTIKIPTPFWCPEKIETPSGVFDFPFKKGNYNFLNSAGLHYETIAIKNTIRKGLMENELCTWADSELVMLILDEVRRQIMSKHREQM